MDKFRIQFHDINIIRILIEMEKENLNFFCTGHQSPQLYHIYLNSIA